MNECDVNKINMFSILNENFYRWYYELADKYIFKVCKGGRNSAKSTHISFRTIRNIMKYPVNGLVVRKVANTLSTSVFEQLKEATCLMNVDHYWKDYKSPLRLVYKPTGQEILFRGADDPQKIKSIKTSKYPLGILWIEELAEFKTEDEVQTIVDSIIRAELKNGLQYDINYSYNPPKRKTSWVNKKFNTQFIGKNMLVHHSDYTQNPHVSKAFIQEAEDEKARNLNRYKWIYLGEPIGGGIVPFSNLEFRTITDDEIKRFDNIRQGLDFGWSVDPSHFCRNNLDKKRDILYLIDEIRGVKLRNKVLYDELIKRKYNDIRVIADSEDPRGINELKSYGLNIVGAKKGPGSVEYGLEWLDSLNAIVIDPKRTPHTAKELEDADYKLDKDGNTIAELEGEDHGIDGLRYSCENDMKFKRLGWQNKAG
jgi:phage terminase large subunit